MRHFLSSLLITFVLTAYSSAAQGGGEGGSNSAPIDPVPATEWLKRKGIEPLGVNLLGEQIDQHTGALSFEHVDVDLPGNSSLPVAITRQRMQGSFYAPNTGAFDFGDWQLVVPHIRVKTPVGNSWGPSRCSQSFGQSLPTYVRARVRNGGAIFQRKEVRNYEYASGVFLDGTGAGAQQLLARSSGASSAFPNAEYVTKQNWNISCISSVGTSNGGGEGFYATSPNGNRYRMDKVVVRRAPFLGSVDSIESQPDPFYSTSRNYTMVFATEVTDPSGNWVRYDYSASGRLTRIYSNDDREIQLVYSGASGPISEVIANPGTSDQRKWTYAYEDVNVPRWPSFNQTYQNNLKNVTLPDGRSWDFTFANMNVEPLKGRTCAQPPLSVGIKHPAGAVGEFKLLERKVRISTIADMVEPVCYNLLPYSTQRPLPYVAWTENLAVVEKRITGVGLPQSKWTYEYEQDQGDATGPLGDKTNWTKVVDPSGAQATYYHKWSREEFGSKLIKTDQRQSAGGSIIQTTSNTYIKENGVGNTFIPYAQQPAIGTPFRTATVAIERDDETYNSAYSYNTNLNSVSYSYGQPISSVLGSNLGNTQTQLFSYENNKPKWILSLPKSVTLNGRLYHSYVFDVFGRPTEYKKFGTSDKLFTYHTGANQSGALASVENADGDVSSFQNYQSGAPQAITLFDGAVLGRTINANGWLTSATDALGSTTGFEYNSSGWLKKIDKPGAWADTNIGYTGIGTGSVKQTDTTGRRQKITWHDAMLRPVRVLEKATSGDAPDVHVKLGYDSLGRQTFQSLPSGAANSNSGAYTTYDALSRVTKLRDSLTGAETLTAYLSGGKVRTTDPKGNETTVASEAFGSPANSRVKRIAQPLGLSTTMAYDAHGNITQLRQWGSNSGYSSDVTRKFWYDNKNQLCRHRAPELGDELFQYDALGRLQHKASGLPSGNGCTTAPANKRVSNGYDAMGRLLEISYGDSTPSAHRTYDGNGNLLSSKRDNGVDWYYQYDDMNNITREDVSYAGENYWFAYDYTGEGYLSKTTSPYFTGGVEYAPNGAGQPTQLRINGNQIVSGAQYHLNGQVKSLSFGQGSGYGYSSGSNARNLLTSSKFSRSGETALDYSYAYDSKLNRMTHIVDNMDNGLNRAFYYDDLGRLKSSNGYWGNGTFKYDVLGNLRQKTLGGRTVDIDYNGSNRVSEVKDTADGNFLRTYTYDARGNTTSNGRHSFTYDLSNQPVSYNGPGAANKSHVYDANFKRVVSTSDRGTIYSVYSSVTGTVAFQYNTATEEYTSYVTLGPVTARFNEGTFERWVLNDHLGSAVAAINGPGGDYEGKEGFTPFGEARYKPELNWDKPSFTGHVADSATGLTYMQARYYDPVIGRFLSTDPIGYQDQLNLYAYVHNDPVNKTDPTGKCSKGNSESSIACGMENFINDKITTPIANATFAAADAIRGAVGADAVERQDLGGEAAQAHEGPVEFSGSNEVKTLGSKVAVAGVLRYNPVKGVKGITAAVGKKSPSRSISIDKRNGKGADGGISFYKKEKIDGRTNSTTHTVMKDGRIVHQHQDHVGKYGTARRFSDDLTGTQTVGNSPLPRNP